MKKKGRVYLTFKDRVLIEHYLSQGKVLKDISEILDINYATVVAEYNKNKGIYNALDSQIMILKTNTNLSQWQCFKDTPAIIFAIHFLIESLKEVKSQKYIKKIESWINLLKNRARGENYKEAKITHICEIVHEMIDEGCTLESMACKANTSKSMISRIRKKYLKQKENNEKT